MKDENNELREDEAMIAPPKGPGIYQIVEAGGLGVAFAVIYSFGILRFTQMVAMEWGRTPAIAFAVFAVVIAIAFLDAISRLLNETRKPKDSDKA